MLGRHRRHNMGRPVEPETLASLARAGEKAAAPPPCLPHRRPARAHRCVRHRWRSAELDLVGPLGTKSHIEPDMGTIVCIGGGIGVAPVYPIARGMKQQGNKVISILGAKSKDILIFEDEMKAVSDEVLVTTDDGSYGIKGFVTTALQQIIDRGEKIAEVIAIGPVVMMRSVAEATRPYNISTIVSLNPIMVDGTGMCGGCRVQVGDDTKFACVDGPEFDGHKVDFKGLMARQRMYRDQESSADEHYCRCQTLGLKKEEDCECHSH